MGNKVRIGYHLWTCQVILNLNFMLSHVGWIHHCFTILVVVFLVAENTLDVINDCLSVLNYSKYSSLKDNDYTLHVKLYIEDIT